MFDRATFYAYLRRSSLFDHGLTKRQVTGTEAILNAWDKSGYTDLRWLAYALGTTYHETGRAMYPVPEGSRGKGHPYGVPGPNGQAAYGRGFVQITWGGPSPRPDNYAKADKLLGLGGKLVADYDLALDPDIAAQILLRGMAEGWFTHFKFADYLNDHLADYLHARRIVNSMDKAELIAGYTLVFFSAIQAGEHKAADHTAPTVVAKSPSPAAVPQMPEDVLKGISDALQPLQTIADTVGSAIPPAPASPSPGTSAPQPAADTDTGNDIMNALSILAGLFGGVSGKIGVATTVMGELPHLVQGTVANLGELPKVKADIDELVSDIKAGKWSETPNDLHALIAEFGVILKNYGVSLPALTTMVDKLPAEPAVSKAA